MGLLAHRLHAHADRTQRTSSYSLRPSTNTSHCCSQAAVSCRPPHALLQSHRPVAISDTFSGCCLLVMARRPCCLQPRALLRILSGLCYRRLLACAHGFGVGYGQHVGKLRRLRGAVMVNKFLFEQGKEGFQLPPWNSLDPCDFD